MPNKGLEAKPGDRGDATKNSGLAKIKTGNSGKLQAPCSKGYEDAPGGWGGNVKR